MGTNNWHKSEPQGLSPEDSSSVRSSSQLEDLSSRESSQSRDIPSLVLPTQDLHLRDSGEREGRSDSSVVSSSRSSSVSRDDGSPSLSSSALSSSQVKESSSASPRSPSTASAEEEGRESQSLSSHSSSAPHPSPRSPLESPRKMNSPPHFAASVNSPRLSSLSPRHPSPVTPSQNLLTPNSLSALSSPLRSPSQSPPPPPPPSVAMTTAQLSDFKFEKLKREPLLVTVPWVNTPEDFVVSASKYLASFIV